MGHAKFIGRNRICYSLPVSNASDRIGSRTSRKSRAGGGVLADALPGNPLNVPFSGIHEPASVVCDRQGPTVRTLFDEPKFIGKPVYSIVVNSKTTRDYVHSPS
jgi:hypothetical protein